jgi:formylglycine-generating enzyme required for sulfatase activity
VEHLFPLNCEILFRNFKPSCLLLIGALLLLLAGCEKSAVNKPAEDKQKSPLHPVKSEKTSIEWPREYVSPVDGSRMLLVEGGRARLGSEPGTPHAVTDEFPAQEFEFEPFYMDETEVTIGQFGLFVEAGGYENPGAWESVDWDWLQAQGIDEPVNWLSDRALDMNLPVTAVTLMEARTWARWAGRRLPTEFEWEYAARGDDLRIYPWGSDPAEKPPATTDRKPVQSTGEPPSYWDLRDMGGSVREWTSSLYGRYPESRDRNIDYSGGRFVARGGWFGGELEDFRCAARTPQSADSSLMSLGFRTVIDAADAFPEIADRGEFPDGE